MAPSEFKGALLQARRSFVFVGFFSLFINLLMLTSPLYMLQLYDRVMVSRSQETLLMLTLLVTGLFITLALLEMIRSRVLIKVGNKLDGMLSDRIFESVFELQNKMPGKSTSQSIADFTQIRQFMTSNGLFAFFDAPWLFIYIGVLFLFHPWYGYFAIGAAIILVIITLVNEYSTKEKLGEANGLNRQAILHVDKSLRNAEVIHAMGMLPAIKERWQQKHYGFLTAQEIASGAAGLWSNLSKSLRMLFQSLMLGLGGYLAINMEISPGMLIAGSILLGRALAPLDLMINGWKNFSNARASYYRLDALLKDFPKKAKPMELPAPEGELVLENVVVIPPGGANPSVKGVNMRIERGDVVGIIGPSAAGKSSLARAILGLWPLATGTVRLDSADVAQWDRELLGKHVGYLPQDIELFEGTVSENICRFQEINSEKVVEAARLADVHAMILHLPDGYDTYVGAGGATLSGGQRQRIALARALYDNPVVVVLDEPNSNLDEAGEKALVYALENLKARGTTTILITHRPAVLQVTNKLALMSEGALQMFGPTQEVLQKLKTGASAQQPPKQNPQSNTAPKIVALSKPGA